MTLCASWHWAKEFAIWQVLAGPNPEELETVASAPKGFETAITVDVSEAYVGVRAKNSSGRVSDTPKEGAALLPERRKAWGFWLVRPSRPLLAGQI